MIMEIIKTIFIIFVLLNLIIVLLPIKPKLRFTLNTWKKFRIKMFFEIIGLIIITLVVFGFLYLFVPYLKYGWLNLFIKEGGTIAITPVIEESKSPNFIIRIIPPVFFIIFLLAIPPLAKLEEEIYRKGFIKWKDISIQSVKFGLVHMIMGVPLAAAIALIISGLFYGYKYRHVFISSNKQFSDKPFFEAKMMSEDKAIVVSTTYHALYNSILISGLLALSIILIK